MGGATRLLTEGSQWVPTVLKRKFAALQEQLCRPLRALFGGQNGVADCSAVASSGHGALNSDASEVFATADASWPEDQSPSPLKRRRREGHTTVPAVLTRLEAWLEESALPWTALPPADSDELTEILRELGFSALDRVKAREALRAQATESEVDNCKPMHSLSLPGPEELPQQPLQAEGGPAPPKQAVRGAEGSTFVSAGTFFLYDNRRSNRYDNHCRSLL